MCSADPAVPPDACELVSSDARDQEDPQRLPEPFSERGRFGTCSCAAAEDAASEAASSPSGMSSRGVLKLLLELFFPAGLRFRGSRGAGGGLPPTYTSAGAGSLCVTS